MVATHSSMKLGLPGVCVAICGSHVLHNFFKDIANIVQVAQLISKGKALNVWLSTQEPTAKLRLYSKSHLGHELGIVQASEVRFGGFFLMLHRYLRLKPALRSIITDAKFVAEASSTGGGAEAQKLRKPLKDAFGIIKVCSMWALVFFFGKQRNVSHLLVSLLTGCSFLRRFTTLGRSPLACYASVACSR